MAESLEALVRSIHDGQIALDDANEEAVRQAVINPILVYLGWNTEKIAEVYPEFGIEGKRVDYCLRLRGSEQVIIEAKKPGENLAKHEEQLLEYSFRRGVPLAVLTNGMEWWFYLPLKKGPWKERKFFAVDMTSQAADLAAQHLTEFFSKGAVADGSAEHLADEISDDNLRQHKTSEALPKVWAEMMAQPDDLPNELFDLIFQRVESACGYQPSRQQVVDYLSHASSQGVPRATPPQDTDTPKADRVMEILQDGKWYYAAELRDKLNTQSINAVLRDLEQDGAVELMKDSKGNKVRLRQR